MPKIWPVTAIGFPDLFVRLGIQAVPAGPQFWLSDTILPISIVDSQITLAAEAVKVLYSRSQMFSGRATAPTSSTVIVDSGALAAGDYDLQVWATGMSNTGGVSLRMEHRDAANGASIFDYDMLNWLATQAQHAEYDLALTLLANERVRVIAVGNFAAGEEVAAAVLIKRRS